MAKEDWVRIGGIVLIGVGLAVGVGLVRPRARADEEGEAPAAPGLVTSQVEVGPSRPGFVAHGVVVPSERATLAFVDGGRVVERTVEAGDHVEAGQVLAQLDPTPYRNAARATAAARREIDLRLEQVGRDHTRAEQLLRGGVVAVDQVEQIESGHARAAAMREAASARLRESRRRVGEATLRAPFTGVVTDVLVEPGELVGAGQPVLRMAGDGEREVRLEVPAEIALAVEIGDPVELRASGVEADDPHASTTLRAEVAGRGRTATDMTGLYPVTLRLTSAARAGVGVEARLWGPPRDAVRVPLRAVLDPAGRRPFVWAVVEGRAIRRWLRLGPLDGDRVEIREGLSRDDVIVVHGQSRLLEGDPVPSARSATSTGDEP
ncbi:MAG: efflux RND transporter periplasmic adaptor subunit [Myxococcales bacterium]|nr:efflux RND transporter periplasmic adaptor subunit [Myxococcales bacterium]